MEKKQKLVDYKNKLQNMYVVYTKGLIKHMMLVLTIYRSLIVYHRLTCSLPYLCLYVISSAVIFKIIRPSSLTHYTDIALSLYTDALTRA